LACITVKQCMGNVGFEFRSTPAFLFWGCGETVIVTGPTAHSLELDNAYRAVVKQLVQQNSTYPDRLGPSGEFVENSTNLTFTR
jgi:hypothetical protein